MTSQSMIVGTINGVSKKDFDRLKKELTKRFDEVGWKNDVLLIKSERNHEAVKGVFTKIAACVHPGQFGTLLYVGHGNVACFYFGHKKYVGRRYKEPTPPDWWEPQEE